MKKIILLSGALIICSFINAQDGHEGHNHAKPIQNDVKIDVVDATDLVYPSGD